MTENKILGLLNGLSKRNYHQEEGLTNDFLKEQLFPLIDKESFESMLRQYESILSNMVNSDMDEQQLEAYLASLITKKESPITEEQKGDIMKFWNTNRRKLHALMVADSRCSNTIKSVKWRVDIDYKDNTQSCEPKVIFEFGLQQEKTTDIRQENFVFESNTETLDKLIQHTDDIEKAISKLLI